MAEAEGQRRRLATLTTRVLVAYNALVNTPVFILPHSQSIIVLGTNTHQLYQFNDIKVCSLPYVR